MKILYVDFNTVGHHSVYFNEIRKIDGIESSIVLPENNEQITLKQYKIETLSRNMSFVGYLKFISKLNELVKIEKPDLVHILSGDMLYRFFGVGLNIIKIPLIVTFHHCNFSLLKNISYKMIFSHIAYGVVHTNYILKHMKGLYISNVVHIEYPYLEDKKEYDVEELKLKLGIKNNEKVLLSFGETRYDKGLDILLKALANVKRQFKLIIAGKPTDISEKDINLLTNDYQQCIIKKLSYIDDDLMNEFFSVSDVVILPYRKRFAGASGPLTTAVAYNKVIIGPDVNSIGDTIKNNHLGYVFKCENIESLQNVIENAISKDFAYDIKANEYQKNISKEIFIRKYRDLYMDLMKG